MCSVKPMFSVKAFKEQKTGVWSVIRNSDGNITRLGIISAAGDMFYPRDDVLYDSLTLCHIAERMMQIERGLLPDVPTAAAADSSFTTLRKT